MSRPDPRQQTLPIVWSSIVMSTVVFAGFAFFLAPMADEAADPTIALVTGLTALAPATGSLLIGRVLLRELPAQPTWMLRWALAEAVALIGLMVKLLGGPGWFAGGLLFVGTILVLVQYPRTEPD